MKRKEFKGYYRVIQNEGHDETNITESCRSLKGAKKKAKAMSNRVIYRYSRHKGWAAVSARWIYKNGWIRCKWNREKAEWNPRR